MVVLTNAVVPTFAFQPHDPTGHSEGEMTEQVALIAATDQDGPSSGPDADELPTCDYSRDLSDSSDDGDFGTEFPIEINAPTTWASTITGFIVVPAVLGHLFKDPFLLHRPPALS